MRTSYSWSDHGPSGVSQPPVSVLKIMRPAQGCQYLSKSNHVLLNSPACSVVRIIPEHVDKILDYLLMYPPLKGIEIFKVYIYIHSYSYHILQDVLNHVADINTVFICQGTVCRPTISSRHLTSFIFCNLFIRIAECNVGAMLRDHASGLMAPTRRRKRSFVLRFSSPVTAWPMNRLIRLAKTS